MKIILLKDVKKVGQNGSVVEVADGYGQNVLIPRGLARAATAGAIKAAEAEATAMVGRHATDTVMAKVMLAKVDGQTVHISARAGETGTLFQSIHAEQIASAIEKELGIMVPESALTLDEPIKKIGEHHIPIALLGARATLVVQVM